MDQKHTMPMTPFDNLISNEQLQTMKLMLPYMPPGSQKLFAVYVKFLELQETMQFFRKFHTDIGSQSMSGSHPSLRDLFRDIQPYMNAKDSHALEQMMQMLEMIQGFQNKNDAGANPLSMMMGMLSPEQQSMFETYSEMFSNMESQDVTGQSVTSQELTASAPSDTTTDPQKGDSQNEQQSEPDSEQ